MIKKVLSTPYFIPAIVLLIAGVCWLFHFRIDLTSEKRFSISEPSKQLLSQTDEDISVKIYLDGDLNPGFNRLKKATVDMLEEMETYAGSDITLTFDNPSLAGNNDERNLNYARLEAKGLKPTAVYERDKEGKAIQKVIFPWLEMRYKNRQVNVCLLKNVNGKSGDENLNISIENLEFEIMDGIRRLLTTTVPRVAFIEGHGELTEAQTYDFSKSLSRYFQVDRGQISDDASILSPYKLIIVAKPKLPFTETEKFILDQYVMNGGKVIWLVDGVTLATENLSETGLTPSMELDVNLSDLLFRYGVRINPVILQDVQCVTVPVNIAPQGAEPKFEPSPLLYSPLLLTSQQHPITRNVTEVKTEFASGIDLVGKMENLKPTLLLATSNNTHITATPATVNIAELHSPDDKQYFNASYIPVAVLMEGKFQSGFANRMLPGVKNLAQVRTESLPTSQLFVADGDIIRNETNGIASDSTTLELGYDRFNGVTYGNKEMLVNAVLYMTDEKGWMQLKNKTLKLRLLNKQLVSENSNVIAIVNVVVPVVILLVFGLVYGFLRRKKYAGK